MLNTFAHLGHSYETETITTLDHCMPIIIGSGIVIAILIGVIIFLLTTWQPRRNANATKVTKTKAGKKSKQ